MKLLIHFSIFFLFFSVYASRPRRLSDGDKSPAKTRENYHIDCLFLPKVSRPNTNEETIIRSNIARTKFLLTLLTDRQKQNVAHLNLKNYINHLICFLDKQSETFLAQALQDAQRLKSDVATCNKTGDLVLAQQVLKLESKTKQLIAKSAAADQEIQSLILEIEPLS